MAYRIFVVDNSPTIQKIFELVFSGPDYNVLPCENGDELLLRLDESKPDAIILSLSLPGRDGYELATHLNSRPELRGIPLILLRNAFEPPDENRLSSLVFTALVSKPFDSERVAALIREAIGRPSEPQTLPEEPQAQTLPSFQEENSPASDLKTLIHRLIQAEMVSLEREVEKRLRASLLIEITEQMKRWLEEQSSTSVSERKK